ncbi:DEAD/DEAH box helicase [Crossiella equi]|uniref:DEAD/DEAH box helicase n=1 Tax=Crossiella equi TaxID=130796 RepID=UPI0020131D66|nr:DEAD/DEAH box helicase [Crossiella equi]
MLSRARRAATAHPSAAYWGTVAVFGLQLVTGGRASRPSPADEDRIRTLVTEMPAGATQGDPEQAVRDFLAALADGLSTGLTLGLTIPAVAPRPLPVRAPEVRVSLRVEFGSTRLFRAVLQVHSLAEAALVADATEVWAGRVDGLGLETRANLTAAIRSSALAWPPMARFLDGPAPEDVQLADEEVVQLLSGVPGIEVHWPKELGRDLSARAEVTAVGDRPSFFGGDTTFAFNWRLALGEDPLTEAELAELAEARRPVVRLRDRWTLVPPDLRRKAVKPGIAVLGGMDALEVALTGTAVVAGNRLPVRATGWLETLRARIAEPDTGREPVAAPAELAATLRDYQLRGLRWLARMTELGLGGCLADDMGLGKTITVIALHLHRRRAVPEPTLVVCPASLLGNWEREVQRFAPGTPVRRFHGTGRSLSGVDGGFVLTTYGTMRTSAEELAAFRWGLVVADEAQHVKNPRSGTAKALRTIPAPARVALTGTPVENTLSELWAVLDWTTPGLLGSLPAFRNRWAKRIEGTRDTAVAERFATLVRPFLLRRRKSDPGIAPELPPKTETDQPVALTREQAVLYQATVRESLAAIRGSDGPMARRGRIVSLLTALKQICNHPAQYLKETEPRLPRRSGKLELLDELLDTILAEDGAVLVFTQYVAMARLLETHLADRGVPAQLLHGGTPVRQREELVARFQDGAVPVFLLSLKAAGTGLNLTRADHVVHYDRWWNPAVEDQATDRAYRIGQTRPVQVHRLIAEGTVEDRIAELIAAKKSLADSVLTLGEAAFTELSDEELADLVELRR